MAPKYSTHYNADWENHDLFPDLAPWIQRANNGQKDDINHYSCKVCNSGRLKLSNMGVTAPRSHMKDNTKNGITKVCKHNQRMKQLSSLKKDCFVKQQAEQASTSTSQEADDVVEVIPPKNAELSKAGQPTILMYLTNAPPEVVQAWTFWCLHVVYKHRSYNSAGCQGDLFRKMFPDSKIAIQYGSLCRQKIAYMVSFGLAPFYKKCIMSQLAPVGPRLQPLFVSCFDESFNSVTASKQMDIHILYFNEESKLVERTYLGSQFMGHATHEDTLVDFKEAHKGLDIVHNLVQLSMDGPHVNWKFADELAAYRQAEDPNAPDLINIGSCGLHVIHGAYGTAQGVTNWEIQKTLKAAHGIFKGSSARRADYLDDNGIDNVHDQSTKCNFPLKFCGHRWLENGKAITRFLEIIEKVSLFLKKSQEKKRRNFDKKDERFPLLLKNTSAKIYPAYLEFSNSVCRDIEPFLTFFQAERPLGVFLFTKLKDMFVCLLERIVTTAALSNNKTAYRLQKLVKVISANRMAPELLPRESINVGFAAKAILRKLTTTEKTLERTMRQNVQNFIIRLLEKIVERGPLMYKFTRSISSLSPLEITVVKTSSLISHFNDLVTELYDDKWLTILQAENAEKQYKELVNNNDFLSEAKKFDIMNDRVDEFYSRILDSSKTTELERVVRFVNIISHGNARVEGGFSINDDILLPNMAEETVVAQRIVYEGVHKAGGPSNVEINGEMLKMVRNSHKLYEAERKKKQEKQSEGQKRIVEKRKATMELNTAVAKRKAVLDEMKSKMNDKISEFDTEITSLQEQIAKK